MGLLGSCMVAFDGIAHVEGDFMSGGANELRGALLIAASCTSYSLATVRLGVYGEVTRPWKDEHHT